MWGTAICQLWLVKFLTPGLVVLAAGFSLLTVAVLCCEAEPLVRARQFLKLPRLQQALVVFAVCILTVCAQKQGTRNKEQGTSAVAEAFCSGCAAESGIENSALVPCSLFLVPCSLTTNDIARGYVLVEVRTNETVSYEMPTNGVVVGTWGKTGAYQDVVRVCLSTDCTDWHGFVWGNEVVTSLWAHTWGKVRPRIRDRVHEIVVVGTPMSCVAGEGRLWTAETTNGTWVITWENFVEGRRIKQGTGNKEQGTSSVAEASGSNFNACTVETRSVSEGTFAVGEPEGRTSGCENGDLMKETRSSFQASVFSQTSKLRAKTALTSSSTNPCESVQSVADSQFVQSVKSVAQNISAQVEFFANGDFITRSNEIECVYRRVNPDDWDDDGIANEEDDEPMLAADETQFGPNQTLPDGANSNAYCWIDLVVSRANAKVTFVGEGASNLTDPSFVAKAGETNRVTLLIGKSYRATCAFPFKVVAKSSDEIGESWDGENEVDLCWPVTISVTTDGDAASDAQAAAVRQMQVVDSNNGTLLATPLLASAATTSATTSDSFSMVVIPSGLGGSFVWTNSCCSITGSAYAFEQACEGNCGCSGCTAEGRFVYEGYSIVSPLGPSCRCSDPDDDDDPPKRGVQDGSA